MVGSRGCAARTAGMLLEMARSTDWGWPPGFRVGWGGLGDPLSAPCSVLVFGDSGRMMLGLSFWHASGEGWAPAVLSPPKAMAVPFKNTPVLCLGSGTKNLATKQLPRACWWPLGPATAIPGRSVLGDEPGVLLERSSPRAGEGTGVF